MTHDLYDPSGGELAPYSPGGDLQPIQPADDWGRTDVDYLSERPAPASQDPQAAEVFKEIGIIIAADLQRLNHPAKSISAAQQWYAANMGKEPRKEPVKHRYNLHDMQSDVMANNFGNAMARAGASQEFVSNVLWLLAEAVKRLTGNAVAQGRAPTSADPTDALSDSDYEKVVAINAQAAARTEGYLRDKFGSSYEGNMRVIREHWNKLSTAEQEHLSAYTTGWVRATNTPEILLGLFQQAIGSGSIPANSVDIAREIASYENIMKTERSKWMKDDAMQARYRYLLDLQSGGR